MEENQGYVIRQSVLFDNDRGFALGEHPREGFVTWQFTQEGGHRDYYWGHYHSDPQLAEADYHNRAEDYQRRYHVQEVEQERPQPGPYKYYSTQRPIDIGTYPQSYFNRPIHMTVYTGREQVEGEAFRAWGDLTYAQPLTEREMADYELRPSRDNPDVKKRMERQAEIVGRWEDAKHIPDPKRLTWFYPDFGSYVVKEFVTPEQLSQRADTVERQRAAAEHKREKPSISRQREEAGRQAQERQAPPGPKKDAPDRGDR